MALATCLSSLTFAQDDNASGLDVLEPFEVIGSKEKAKSLGGTGTYLDADDIGAFFHTDINEILRQVPGVYIRGEEGYGLFPNLSLRGVDPNRSGKVTILEDGIPSSPSPFSDPSAYYSPTAGRMAGFEVLKGSSQLKFGPNTTGGVINYLSTPIPNQQASHLRLSYGEHNERISHAYTGGKTPFGGGTLGYLVEIFDHRTDGWKTVDGIGGFRGADSPVAKTDLMLKLSYEFSDTDYIEFKVGRTDLDADVGYIGLTEADFNANPYRRYVGSSIDNMDSDQTRYYVRYLKELSDEMKLSTTFFSNEFNRNWYKAKYSTFDSDAVLQGTADGNFTVKNNDRTYEVWGIQSNLEWELDNHLLDIGFRYTDDVYTSNPYTEDTYTVVANTSVTGPFGPSKAVTTSSERSSEAIELYITDEITVSDQLTVTPGARYTDVDYVKTATGSRDDILFGVGATYVLSDTLAGFGGLYQGHALPGASGGTSGLNIEESLGLEIGLRGSLTEDVAFELAYFRTDYKDMLALESLAGGVPNSANIGEAEVQGIELSIATDLGKNQGIGIPFSLSLTYTDAEFTQTVDGDDFWDDVTSGNEMPYIPDLQYNVRTGLVFDNLSTYLNYHWQAEVYSDGANTATSKVDSYGVLDWSAFYPIAKDVEIFGKVTNLLDKEYAVSNMPDLWRAGAPRIASIGLKFDF